MRYLLLLLLVGCVRVDNPKQSSRPANISVIVQPRRQPAAMIPVNNRYRNPDGSCVHISWCYATMWQSDSDNKLYEMSEWWHKRHHGGEGSSGLRRKADAAGLKYADTTNGDIEFVDRACRTGRGCIVNDASNHVRFLAGIDPAGTPNAKAYVMDNNGKRDTIKVYDRNDWIARWRSHGGWAATPIYNPAPAPTWQL